MYLKRVPPFKYMNQAYEEPLGHVPLGLLPGHESEFYDLMFFPLKNDIFPKLEEVVMTPDVRELLSNNISPNFTISQIGEVKKSKDSDKIEDLLAVVWMESDVKLPDADKSLKSDAYFGGRAWVFNKNGPIASIPEDPKKRASLFTFSANILYVNERIYVVTKGEIWDASKNDYILTGRIMEYPTMKDVFGSPNTIPYFLGCCTRNRIYMPQYDLEYGEYIFEHDKESREKMLIEDDKVYLLVGKVITDNSKRKIKMGFVDEDGKSILGWHDKIEYSLKEDLVKTFDIKNGETKINTLSVEDII